VKFVIFYDIKGIHWRDFFHLFSIYRILATSAIMPSVNSTLPAISAPLDTPM